MKELIWHYDEKTEFWAKRVIIPLMAKKPKQQYDGSAVNPKEEIWKKYILKSEFSVYCNNPNWYGLLICSPNNIIQCFRDKYMLEALALTVVWGSMAPAIKHIYNKPKGEIETTLFRCFKLIEEENSVEGAWNLIVNDLAWKKVMTSKTLHFLTRSMDYDMNPPVPIDKGIIIDKVWKNFIIMVNDKFRRGIDPYPPNTWGSSTWESYNCYMTAINVWAGIKGWTTTQLENTIYKEYQT